MFAAFKYHAVDYLYERMTRQRFSFERLSIHVPSCLYQDKAYYHDGSFADDKYRRPWKRVDSAQIMMNFSVLDHWKKCLYIDDFLEKKPISSTLFHIHHEDIEVVPSSNPCSQTDIEDAHLLVKDDDKQYFNCASHLQSNYAPMVLKEQQEELYIEDELVFTDNLAQHAKWLPNLQTLLGRLSIFYVQDPLLNSKGENITEDDIFSECFAFKRSMTFQGKRNEPHQDFSKVILKDEETLVLPLVDSYKTISLSLNTEIPTCSVLKSLLHITPEVIEDESESHKMTSEDFGVTITPEIEISKYDSTHNCTDQTESTLECKKLVNYISFQPGELEVPLTPPCRSQRGQENSIYSEVQLEPVSPLSKSVLITESIKEYLEGLVWQSEKYHNAMNSLLLPECERFVLTSQHLPVTELKKMLSIQEEISTFSHEEDEWINFWENLALPCILEALSSDLSCEKRLVSTNVEAFSKITAFHLGKWLEECNSAAHNIMESTDDPDYGETKDSHLSPQKNETFLPLLLRPVSDIRLHNENASLEKHAMHNKLQSETEKAMNSGNQEDKTKDQLQPVICKEMSVEPNVLAGGKGNTAVFQLPRKRKDDFDLLSNFIMLRSKHVFSQREETNNAKIQEEDAGGKSPTPANQDSPVPKTCHHVPDPTEKQTVENEDIVSIQIKASESQFQAYRIIEATAAPILREFLTLGIHHWSFATLRFEDTRYFLKQQEKMISDTFEQGMINTKDEKDITLFKRAALLHLLVTVRDLLLTCSLNTALGYLSKAKDMYQDFLGSSLENIWRQLKIVQFARQKKHETYPKITELQYQISEWIQRNPNEQNKVAIMARMDFDDEMSTLINTLSSVQGLKVIYLKSEKRGALLDSKNILSSLEKCSCVVVHNQPIGPDFPWTRFSLLVEYNYSDNSCWIDVCKNLNLSYITFVTPVPEMVEIDSFGCVLLGVPIPYVFLTSEGLLNSPEILQLLESKYNITFIERSCCESLQFFGNTDRYVVMTVDECTAIIMQNVEELKYEKSSDNFMLRLMALSLQYSYCWIILYSREKLNSEYSLAGKTLNHLALIYAALVPFSQKSEDFGVKVVLTPGIEETAFLIRQIADYVLMTSKRPPHEWLDKSWLSVLPSEEEKCLLTFPCMNPLVAQTMLKKSSSLEWLLSTTFDQLQELLPEVPEKVLKHFSDITSLYTINPPTQSKLSKEIVPLQKNMPSAIRSCPQVPFSEAFQGHRQFPEYSECLNVVQSCQTCTLDYSPDEISTPLKPKARHSSGEPPASYQGEDCSFEKMKHNIGRGEQLYLPFLKNLESERKGNLLSLTQNNLRSPTCIQVESTPPSMGYKQCNTNTYLENWPQMEMCRSKVPTDQVLDVPALLKNPTYDDIKEIVGVRKPSPMKQPNSHPDSKHSGYLVFNRGDGPFQQSPSSFLGAFGRTVCRHPKFQFEDKFWDNSPSMQTNDSSLRAPSFCKPFSNPDRFCNLKIPGQYSGNKRTSALSSNQRRDVSAGLKFTELPQLKKRRLTFEKDPGRTDGQTRLKFF